MADKTVSKSIAELISLDVSFVDDVISRLESFRYQVKESDTWVIGFSIQKVVNTIKNECNVLMIPDELNQVAVDRVCGEFMLGKKECGQLDGFDLEAAVKQIQEGDTNVVFAIGDGNMTPEQRLNHLIGFLMTNGKEQFTSFRRLKW